MGFHYDQKFVRQSLRRLESRRRRQEGKKRGGLKGLRKPVDVVLFRMGKTHRDRRYDPRELVENDVIVHEIFGLKESDTYKEDKKLNDASRQIHARLHEMQQVFGDFAYNFIRRYARTT